jgi:hypothetical protein
MLSAGRGIFRVRSMHVVLGGPFSEQAQDDASGVRGGHAK